MPPIPPTSDGIRTLVTLDNSTSSAAATAIHADLVVAVFPSTKTTPNPTTNTSLTSCVVSDGKDYVKGFLLGSGFTMAEKQPSQQPNTTRASNVNATNAFQSWISRNPRKPVLLRVESWIVSKCCFKDFVVFLTSGVVVQTHCRNVKKPPTGTAQFRPFSLSSSSTATPQQQGQAAAQGNNSAGDTASSLRVLGGVAPDFFREWGPILRMDALAGCGNLVSPKPTPQHQPTPLHSTTAQQQAASLAKFLAHHNAIRTLQQSASASASPPSAAPAPAQPNNNNNATTTDTQYEYYMSALQEFTTQQLDRQKASLTSNSGREDAQRAPLVETQYLKALDMAWTGGGTQQEPAQRLTRATLCYWHSLLCGEGVHPEAGRLRTKQVRVGPTNFCRPEQVPAELERICESLTALEARLWMPHPTSSPGPDEASLPGWRAATFAAAVFFGLVDVHPFVDGNGRLSRIALNWALHKAGLPFPIVLFATPVQRQEYTEAIRKTRRNLSLTFRRRGDTDVSVNERNHLMVQALEVCGALGPLVELVLDRVSKATLEFDRLVQEKIRAAAEASEAKAAKAVRDRERAGSCLICFEDHPNIATLCCGKAVHLNCVAQWLSSNTTCPNCRESFPALPPRMQAPHEGEAVDDTTSSEQDNDTSSTTGTAEWILPAPQADFHSFEDATTSDTDDDTTTVEVVVQAAAEEDNNDDTTTTVVAQVQQQNDDASTSSTTELDDTTTTDAAVPAPPQESDTTTTTSDVSDTETTAVGADTTILSTTADSEDDTAAATNNHHATVVYCSMGSCRNRPAQDCVNSCCGRCCILQGRFACLRHGTAG